MFELILNNDNLTFHPWKSLETSNYFTTISSKKIVIMYLKIVYKHIWILLRCWSMPSKSVLSTQCARSSL